MYSDTGTAWLRVETFHPECYAAIGSPYGEAVPKNQHPLYERLDDTLTTSASDVSGEPPEQFIDEQAI